MKKYFNNHFLCFLMFAIMLCSTLCLGVLPVLATERVSEAAVIYEPDSGIVNPPVVVEQLTDSLPANTGERGAVVMAEVDADMNVLGGGGQVLTSVNSFIDVYRTVLIPAFIIDSEAEADALAALIAKKDIIDCYVMADAEDAALVRRVRLANKTTAAISGALIFDDLNTPDARKQARDLVADNMSYVAISRAPLDGESAEYFAVRQIAAWSYANDSAGVYRGIVNGYHGIISSNACMVYDVYESITEPTVSGKPIIIAHRGANKAVGYPENTLMGYRAAVEEFGADAIEIDVRLTKDGYAYLMHDSTVERTTNGVGAGELYTLKKLKDLIVDEIPQKQTEVPLLEELFEEISGTDIVVYCHINAKKDDCISAFSYLVDKYDCRDNVVFFISYPCRADYNSSTKRVDSNKAYGYRDLPVVTNGFVFTSGDDDLLNNLKTHLDGIVAMRRALVPYNYQALFYKYSDHGSLWGSESFYYQMSARGFVNTHSITDGQKNMDKLALTGEGAVGFLTDDLDLCDDYHYRINAESVTLDAGQPLELVHEMQMTVGTVTVDCQFTQLSGPQLINTENGYTLDQGGTVVLVYYADRTADGGSSYRVYSEPVEITFLSEEESAPADNSETTPTEDNDHATSNKRQALLICGIIAALLAVVAACVMLVKRGRR